MRKVFWCSCAGMLTVAVCVYLTTRCAKQYPDSVVVLSGKLAWRICTEWNPAVQLGRTVSSTTVGYFHPDAPERTCAGTTVACARPADPGPGVVPPAIIEVIDLSGFQSTPVYPLENELVQVEVRGLDPITVLPGAIEEAEAPAEMPPADDEVQEPTTGALDRWLSLVQEEEFELLPMPKVDEGDAALEQLPTPQENEAIETMPEESEDDAAAEHEADYHRQHPECPYGGACPGMYKSR